MLSVVFRVNHFTCNKRWNISNRVTNGTKSTTIVQNQSFKLMICPEYTSCCGVTSCSAQRSWELTGITYWERSGVNAATPWAPPRSAEAPPALLVPDESRHSTGPGGARCWLSPWWRDGHDSRTPRRVDTGYHDEEGEEEDVGVLSWSWGTSEDQKDKKSSNTV